ncbi:MAG: CHAT domain-containing protein [Alphaproteobacteria bacterium]|nr:CHAT domain-containing protein [Alphaproteobacteria bacterium]
MRHANAFRNANFGMAGIAGLIALFGLVGCGGGQPPQPPQQTQTDTETETAGSEVSSEDLRTIQSGADVHVAVRNIDDIVARVEKALARWEAQRQRTFPENHWNPPARVGYEAVRARERLASEAAAAGLFEEALRQTEAAARQAENWKQPGLPYILTGLSVARIDRGDIGQGIADAQRGLAEFVRLRLAGEIGLSANLVDVYSSIGDFDQARVYMGRTRAARDKYVPLNPRVRYNYDALVFATEARLLWSSGDLPQAEAAGRRCVTAQETDNRLRAGINTQIARLSSRISALVRCLTILAETLKSQGRLAEAESVARRAYEQVDEHLGYRGTTAPKTLSLLAGVLAEQGRIQDAKKLVRLVIKMESLSGADGETLSKTAARAALADLLVAERKWDEAFQEFASMDQALPADGVARLRHLNRNLSRVLATIKAGDAGAALAVARAVNDRITTDFGENHPDAVEARGLIGLAQLRTGDKAAAAETLRPIAEKMAGDVTSYESTGLTGARPGRQRAIVEGYLALVAAQGGSDAAERVFTIVEDMRGRSIGRAIGASSLPKAARTPEAAALVEQMLDKQAHIGSLQQALLNAANSRTESRESRNKNQAAITTAQREAAALKQQIRTQFPELEALMDPQPATIASLKAKLRPTEAFVSTYTAEDQTYVWAISARGTVMAVAPLGTRALEGVVAKVRAAFESHAGMLEDVPAFDVAAAHELYRHLLAPVEAGWQGAATMIVAPHSALAQVPLSVLTTAPATLAKGATLFAEYKAVPWLGRKVAIAQVPSGSAFLIQRTLPAGNPGRKPFIGFGNPVFSKGPGDSQGVGGLDPLPDTEPELIEIASALGADREKDLFLGAAANDTNVKQADIARRKVVMFATHGLIPGEIDGLTQPAIALSPAGTGGSGEGLLTMADILTLKFDADWVVLSACNTASGQGEGAEALSGLGRAFFYAGARSMLVTNWSVESVSARQMTTGLFKRYAANPTMSRAEMLKLSMLDLLDGPGSVEGGKTVFAYAHPLFWAPFSLVGDPG